MPNNIYRGKLYQTYVGNDVLGRDQRYHICYRVKVNQILQDKDHSRLRFLICSRAHRWPQKNTKPKWVWWTSFLYPTLYYRKVLKLAHMLIGLEFSKETTLQKSPDKFCEACRDFPKQRNLYKSYNFTNIFFL